MEDYAEARAVSFFSRHNRKITTVLFLAIFIIATIVALNGRSGSVAAEMDSSQLGVVGSYGDPIFIRFEEIIQVQLADTLIIGDQLEGEETENTRSGLYENDAFGIYTLHVYSESAPYIVVTYGDGDTLVFNQKSAKRTQEIYENLTEHLA